MVCISLIRFVEHDCVGLDQISFFPATLRIPHICVPNRRWKNTQYSAIVIHTVQQRKFNHARFEDCGGGCPHNSANVVRRSEREDQKCGVTVESKQFDAKFVHKCQNSWPQRGNRMQSTGRMFKNCCVLCWKFLSKSRMLTTHMCTNARKVAVQTECRTESFGSI